jgi:hypothetical protein
MNTNASDQSLVNVVSASTPTTIEEVIVVMKEIDLLLPSNDGLKWFNLLYLMVTKEVLDHPPQNGWLRPGWISHLDVVFANLYFLAIKKLPGNAGSIPSSWTALFEARQRTGIDRIQFALAGMNAHINHDLPFALEQTNKELNVDPGHSSPEHDDFEQVNNLLESVLPNALEFLAAGILGQIAQDSGKIGRLLAMWNVRKARDTGWENSNLLEQTEKLPPLQRRFVAVLDSATGLAGRGLLLPIQ